ncbi:hypothetical protein BJ508DRAFT_415909 [Ascobolus immersus RN42]|uniref:Uncharacterized protein n=1 Tax=Ascobolus immersus RN42 TaxID=1160509 RepID=A0A3N4I5F5_ASCIM|nr:hypothetical protein BJ508DRAFT_415909 [Ascobolus immersus RN42]
MTATCPSGDHDCTVRPASGDQSRRQLHDERILRTWNTKSWAFRRVLALSAPEDGLRPDEMPLAANRRGMECEQTKYGTWISKTQKAIFLCSAQHRSGCGPEATSSQIIARVSASKHHSTPPTSQTLLLTAQIFAPLSHLLLIALALECLQNFSLSYSRPHFSTSQLCSLHPQAILSENGLQESDLGEETTRTEH